VDWARAIDRNREALRGIVAVLFAMLEQAGGGASARIPRPLHRAVLFVLRPAESAVRRLIVIAARGLKAKPASSRPLPAGLVGRGRRRRAFPLFDRRKRFAGRRPGARATPRIRMFGNDPRVLSLWASPAPGAPPVAPAPPDDGRIDARRLSFRLEAVKLALEDLPRQARRLVRLLARREKEPHLRLRSPLRPGRPPGHRERQGHAVDRVLADCHGLACWALAPDTS